MEKLKVFEGFAGIGAVSKAIERLGIPHELVGFSEIDKYAIKSFCAVHGVDESLNWGDVCKIDETKLPDMDLYTFGSPCQDFSVAGKQKGAVWTCNDCTDEQGNPTEYNPLDVHWSKRDVCPICGSKNINKSRSSLVVEALRIIRHKKPKYLLMENVKNLVGKQFKPSFDKIIAELKEYGYNTYWDVLNAKQYGVPQNRERVFVVGIRKDIDTGLYKFPKGFDNGIRLKDMLEEHIADKYYLSQDVQNRLKFNDKQTSNKDNNKKYLSKAIDKIIEKNDGKIPEAWDIYSKNPINTGIAKTLSCDCGHTGTAGSTAVTDGFKIRKLTPRECWRLMGFNDTDFDNAKSVGMSDTQLYKQAGNSIVVNCLEYMFKELFITSVKSLHNIG